MADRVPDAIDQAAHEISPALTPSARTLADRLQRFVASTTKSWPLASDRGNNPRWTMRRQRCAVPSYGRGGALSLQSFSYPETAMHRHIPSLTALALAIASAAFHVGTAQAADPAAAKSAYAQERADCEAGRSQQDRATCLKEAGAAAEEKKRNGLANPGSARQNAAERCKALPAKDKADCLARIEGPTSTNQQVTTSGSVRGGGVIRETRTTTTGPAAAAEAVREPAASAPR